MSERRHEIGIRVALGATRSEIFKIVLSQGVRLAVLGLALGLIGAVALTRFLEDMLFEVSATDPATFAGISLLLLVVVLLACFVPARRATLEMANWRPEES